MRYRFLTALVLLWLASGCCRRKVVEAWLVDSLVNVFPDDSVGSNSVREARFAAARRSNFNLQLALRSGVGIGDLHVDALPLSGPGMPIDRMQVRLVEYVVATTNTPCASRNAVLRKAPALFPDALLTSFPMTVEKNKTRSVWITIPVPADQAPGQYSGVLRLRQGAEELSRVAYTLDVTKATVPIQIPFDVAHRVILNEAYSRQFYRTSQFTGQWWIIAGNVARFLAGYHQTFVPADPMDLVVATASGGSLRYDFSNYARFVRLFEAAGVRGALDAGQLLARGGRQGEPLTVRIWLAEDGRAVQHRVAASDPRVPPLLAGFHTALRQMLAANGWEGRYALSVLDSPDAGEAKECAQWEAAVRRLMPAAGFTNAPKTRALIDHPLLETRTLGWFTFRKGERGLARWEENRWSPDPFRDTQPAIGGESGFPPPGGVHLVYPNREGRTLFSSIRLEQMRESVEDYALLVELGKRDPARAQALAARVATASAQTPGPEAFRPVLRELLDSF